MNNRENDDELERMRARARRGSGRQDGGRQSSRAYPRPVQPASERRSARQSYDGREEYDEEYYYGEDYDVEEDRQIDFPMEDYLDDEPPMPPAGLGPLMVRLVLPKDGVRRSPRETEMPRAGNHVSREVPPLIRTGPEQHSPFQGIRGAPQKGSRILWKGAGHLPDDSRDKWQNDVKKADGRGFFCSFWLHL